MQRPREEIFARPKWNEAGLWMGCDFLGLLRILSRNRFRVHPSYLPDCLIDLTFSLANTGVKGLQALLLGRSVGRVRLGDDPIVIIGHWRTGTTLMHELLALDRRHRCPTTFECFVPNHFLLTERLIKGWTGFLLPRARPVDAMEMGWDFPQEDEFALTNLGVPSPYATFAFPNHPPQFPKYLDLEDLSPAELRRWKGALRLFLRQLIYKRPGRIVLKSPTHTFRLPVLVEMFPEARFVYMVRNPYHVFVSTVRMWKSLYWSQGYQKPNYEGLDEHVLDTFIRMHRRLEATRSLIPSERFHQVRYEDLAGDPVGQMRVLYRRLEIGQFEAVEPAVEAYTRRRAHHRPNRYRPTPELQEQITRRWRPYIERYGYSADG